MSHEQFLGQTQTALYPGEAHDVLTAQADIVSKQLEGYGSAYVNLNGPVIASEFAYTHQDIDGQPATGTADVLAYIESGPARYSKTYAVARLEGSNQSEGTSRFGLLQIDRQSKASRLDSEITADINIAERSPRIEHNTLARYRPGELFTHRIVTDEQKKTQSIQISNRSLSGSVVQTLRPVVARQQEEGLPVVAAVRAVETSPRPRRNRLGQHVARILGSTIPKP